MQQGIDSTCVLLVCVATGRVPLSNNYLHASAVAGQLLTMTCEVLRFDCNG